MISVNEEIYLKWNSFDVLLLFGKTFWTFKK